MTRTVELTTRLSCDPDTAWHHVQRPALLQHIAWPLIRFVPKSPSEFPDRWADGEYRAWMLSGGILPLGWQAIVISYPAPEGAARFLRDNGYSPLIRRWDHLITIEPDDAGGTRYTDRVHVEAGVLTPIVAAFAKVFYAHRQRRWRKLATIDFREIAEV